MIPLHCLWAKLNYRTCGQFECDMTWFYLCFFISFVHIRGAVVVPQFVGEGRGRFFLNLVFQGQRSRNILDGGGQGGEFLSMSVRTRFK